MGKVKVLLDDGRGVEMESGANLFTSLRSAGVFIPTVCGGKGFCGKCRVKVSGDKVSAPSDRENKLLTTDDLASGMRLACQVSVNGDISVTLPAESSGIGFFQGEVYEHLLVAQDVMKVGIRLIMPEKLVALPGAYILLDIPAGNASVTRSYSIATPPETDDRLEINVKLVPGGKGSGFVHNSLKVGDRVTFSAPYGGFRGSENSEPLLCIAGGSGISPVMSILRHFRINGIKRTVKLFFGASCAESISYVKELRRLESELTDFEFFPVVQTPADGFETGVVTDSLMRHIQDASGMSAFVCGSPGMVAAVTDALHKLGLTDDSRIHFDRFS